MKKLLSILGLAVVTLVPAGVLRAQLAAPNDTGVTMGHVHLVVQDLEGGKKFWLAMGATPTKLGANEVMKFQESVSKWKAAGLKTEPGQRAGQAYVTTSDDLVRIEILENTSLTVPIAFDHIHFWVTESSVPEIQSWYVKMFGAAPLKRGQFAADSIPGVALLFAKSDTATSPTKGRGLDHIGFEIKDLEAFCKKAEANGVKFDMPFTKRPDLGISLAFLTDPWGTYIELNEGLSHL